MPIPSIILLVLHVLLVVASVISIMTKNIISHKWRMVLNTSVIILIILDVITVIIIVAKY